MKRLKVKTKQKTIGMKQKKMADDKRKLFNYDWVHEHECDSFRYNTRIENYIHVIPA